MEEKAWTVYCHVNKTNGKMYIGITGRSDPRLRWGRSGAKYRQCSRFYNAIKKYGWDGFEHRILDDGLSKEEASEKERDYVSFYETDNPDKGYNIQQGGYSAGGMSAEGFERFISASRQANMKPISAFDLNGKRLGNFLSITDAAKFLGVSNSGIECALRQENKTCKKMLFRFTEDVGLSGDMSEEYLEAKVRVRRYLVNDGRPFRCTDVVLFDQNGDKAHEFRSIKETAEFLGVYHGCVCGALNGKHPSTCGYYVRRKSDVGDIDHIDIKGLRHERNISVNLMSDDGTVEKTFSSTREAARFVGADHKALKTAALAGRPYHGRNWKIVEE